MVSKPMDKQNAYSTPFRVGVIGMFPLAFFTVFDNSLLGAALMALWTLATLFVLPIIYIVINKGLGHVPDWAIRGPHQ